MITGRQIADRGTNLLDHAGRFMSEHRGSMERIQPLNEMKIAVAHASRGGPHHHLMLARFVEVDVFDLERLLGTVEYGSFHAR